MKETIQENALKKILDIGVFFSVVCLLVLGGEVIIRTSFEEVYVWIKSYPMEVIFNLISMGLLIGLGGLIFKRLAYAVLGIGGLYYIACIVSYYKYTFRQEYMYPTDLKLIGEASNIIKEFNLTLSPYIIWSIGLLVWMFLVLFKIYEPRENTKKIYRLGVLLLIGTVIWINSICMKAQVLEKFGIEITWDIEGNYRNNGYLFSFINHMNRLIVEKPSNYSNKAIENLLVDKDSDTEFLERPNVIMIMSEALYDITTIDNLILSEDPLKNFHEYQEQYIGGNIVTSIAIGGTAQTEYEVLTGNSVNFTGEDNIAYTGYIRRDTAAIPQIFKELGYRTVGIHPYQRNYYSRDKVYPLLGIDEFISEENFLDSERIRGYITDKEVTHRIIEEYEKSKGQPFFTHVVTMQNHAPFDQKVENIGIEVLNSEISMESKQILDTYANGLKLSDIALKELIDYFSAIDEPTIIMIYGDHIPLLGDKQSIFEELGHFDGDENEVDLKKYNTPFLIWNNYGLQQKDYGFIDTSYLGAVMLETIGYREDPYFRFLIENMEKIKAYSRSIYIDSESQLRHISEMKKEEVQALQNMWLIMYDRVFGKGYSIRELNEYE